MFPSTAQRQIRLPSYAPGVSGPEPSTSGTDVPGSGSDGEWSAFAARDIGRGPWLRPRMLFILALGVSLLIVLTVSLSQGPPHGQPSLTNGVAYSMPWPHTPCSGRTAAQLDRSLGRPIRSGALPSEALLSEDRGTQEAAWDQIASSVYGARTWIEWRPARDVASVAFMKHGSVLVLWNVRFDRNGSFSWNNGGCRGTPLI
jgi:hypothetical protein